MRAMVNEKFVTRVSGGQGVFNQTTGVILKIKEEYYHFRYIACMLIESQL